MSLREIVQKEILNPGTEISNLKNKLENSHATGSCYAGDVYEKALFRKIREISDNENQRYFDVLRELGSQTCENIIRYKTEIMEKINEAGEKLFGKSDGEYIQNVAEEIDSIKKKIVQDSRSLTAFWYKREAMNVLKKNGKTVFVFLSANVGLYGDIIRKTFHFFAEQVNRYHPEVIVVGRIGRVLFEETFPGVSYSYFDFPDTHIDLDSIRKISRTIHEYEDVFIFHGRFKNVVEQLPVSSNISGQELGGGAPHDAGARYIFEPTLEDVAIFFETEIFASTLEQSFNESRLAKLASRMMLLDRSTTHIDTEAHKMYFEKQRLRHRTYNKKQLDAVSGVALWGSS